MKKVTVYGYAIPTTRFGVKGSGTLIDLTYYVADEVDVYEILQTINNVGVQLIAKKNRDGIPEQNRVDIHDIQLGVEYVARKEGYTDEYGDPIE